MRTFKPRSPTPNWTSFRFRINYVISPRTLWHFGYEYIRSPFVVFCEYFAYHSRTQHLCTYIRTRSISSLSRSRLFALLSEPNVYWTTNVCSVRKYGLSVRVSRSVCLYGKKKRFTRNFQGHTRRADSKLKCMFHVGARCTGEPNAEFQTLFI